MKVENEMTVGEKLKHFRRIMCFSQEKLGEVSGISIRTIQRIEEGKSVGSGHTITALAKALNINSSDLIYSVPQEVLPLPNNATKLKLLNLSAIAMLIIPLANIIFPAYIYWKNQHDQKIREHGNKIISFQLFWTFGTILIAIVASIILLPLSDTLRASSVPLFVLVYLISSIFNVYFVLLFAININKQSLFLERVPNIL
ncbi:MAG: helix-turn-helix domain-containing protein [Saprospiraceae bacterium]|nr:helix-turn-helix domain-containing protein [Saprospiraceae bacterium]